ncbi:hypothetical protein Tco_1011677 [Tanacetum coccineum]
MDDPSKTMEEYIKLEEEKARRRGRVFNWETATYGKIRVDDDFHDLRSVETEFPAIVVDDTFASQNALPCESKVSTPVNNEIEFIISFDESDDENYVIICDKNSFSYKMISVNNLKTDLENDNEKASIPSFPPPDPTTSYLDDSDFLNDFKNEFPAIVYNVEHNVLYLNDLFPFNIIRLDDLKSDEDNDNTEIDIVQSSGRHQYLRYEALQYTDVDITDFEMRLTRIYKREVHRVQLGGARRRLSWRQFILALGLHTTEEMKTVRFGAYWADSARQIPDKWGLRDYWIGISSAGDFLGTAPSYTAIKDPILKLCHRLIACSIAGRSQAPEKVTVTNLFNLRGMDVNSVNVPYLLARYLRLFAAGRKSGDLISRGKFVARLAEHFRLLTIEILWGLTVIALALPFIDMVELVRLQT